MIRKRVVAKGDVQGVFFRDSTKDEAERRNVAGWVRNREDGAVEAVFEGEEDDVKALVDTCRGGPGQAEVEDLEEHDEQPEDLSGFEVR